MMREVGTILRHARFYRVQFPHGWFDFYRKADADAASRWVKRGKTGGLQDWHRRATA